MLNLKVTGAYLRVNFFDPLWYWKINRFTFEEQTWFYANEKCPNVAQKGSSYLIQNRDPRNGMTCHQNIWDEDQTSMSGFRRTKVDCVLPMVIMSEFRMRAIIGNTHPTLVLGGLILRTPTIWTVLQTVKWSKKCIPTKSVLENQIF